MKDSRFIALFLLGCLLFNYPVLSLFNQGGAILGIPTLYAYLFVAWALLIGLAALIVEKSR